MEIRDPVHGTISLCDEEIPIINNPVFQRLRRIKQLGPTEMVFPGATHTRFLHSLGVMKVADLILTKLFADYSTTPQLLRLKKTVKMAALLHDIGHAPLGHTTEAVMPSVEALKLVPPFSFTQRQATHEDYTLKFILESPLTKELEKMHDLYGVMPIRICDLITGQCGDESYFTIEGVNYFPLCHQLISSEMDCDRMDYLLRDSYFCGVSYGAFDLDWVIDNLKICLIDSQAFLGISERAVSTFDDFLLCRYHMFLMVYFHYKSVCLEQVLMRYFETCEGEYAIASDIDLYLLQDDHHLLQVLQKSKNRYAKQFVANEIPEKVFENFGPTHFATVLQIKKFLKKNKIEYIHSSSKNRISKYYKEGKNRSIFPLKVIRRFHHGLHYIDIDKATDLFQKFSKTHFIDRIHCYRDQMTQGQSMELAKLIDEAGEQ